jgi:DNA-binding NarL/FixJ family response regulator
MKVLVVDDHALIRQAMQGVLKKLRRDAVILEAPNGAKAMQTVAANPDIDLILLDLSLPDRDGFLIFDELRERYPAIAIVVLSAVHDPTSVRKALERGARGYIPKSAQGNVILSALRLIDSGGTYVPLEIIAHDETGHSLPTPVQRHQAQSPPIKFGLSNRQLEVLGLMMQGKNNKTICRMLNLSEATVKTHVTAVLRALNATSRTEAVVRANNLGMHFPEIS